ncbi:YezD family protein [Brevibacillus sp. TJ4]|uniref:YezD family protein n=1 Tax=Brevibacillus sp. TJ4 TaxID=3234853 RepID=UPI0037D4F254
MRESSKAIDKESIDRIIRALEGLEYGSVQIVVHDSAITQIERTEKQRFALAKDAKPSGKKREYE